MRTALAAALLVACGRVGFDAKDGGSGAFNDADIGRDGKAAASYPDEILADDPRAYYRFETVESVLVDSSVHGQDAGVAS